MVQMATGQGYLSFIYGLGKGENLNTDMFVHLSRTLIQSGFLTTPSRDKLHTFWPHEQQLFLVDMNCPYANHTLLQASNMKLMEYPFRWLLIENDKDAELPANLSMFVRSKVYIIRQLQQGKYQIIAKYRLGTDSCEYKSNDIALWNASSFAYYNKLTDARNRTDLERIVVNISMVIVDAETLEHLLDAREKHVEPVTKVNYPLSLHVADSINCTARFVHRDTWGYKSSNTTIFMGMMGDLQAGRAEIAATPTFYIQDRIPWIDVIAQTTPTKAKFIFRAPPLSLVKNVFVLPFDEYVWLACFALVIVASTVLYVITYCEPASGGEEAKPNSVARLDASVWDVLQMHIGAVCQQGSEAEPISGSGRLATIVLFLSFMFLYTSYSANIVALLQSTSDSIRTLDDLLYSKIKLGVEDVPYSRFYFTAQSGQTQKEIYRQKVAPSDGHPDKFMPLELGIGRMRGEFFAFHSECSAAYKVVSETFLEHEKCGLIEIEYWNMYEPYYAIRKNSTYGEIVKASLRKMGERGLTRRAFERIYLKKPKCENKGGNFLSVSFIDCYAAFLVFGIGILTALCIFILENIVYFKCLNSKDKRITNEVWVK